MWPILAAIIGIIAYRVSAHGGALNYTVGETWYPGYDPYGNETTQDAADWMPQRKRTSNNPIFETTNASLSCNTPGTPARVYIPITAGQIITAVYAYWVHTVGPMIAWLAYCANESNDCHTFDSAGASWFKIGQRGLLSGTIESGTWFQKAFSNWDGRPSLWEERIPETLRPGRYLLRHETISLHSAHRPQFYPECAHLEVSGGGEGVPGEEYLVGIPGVWSMDRKFHGVYDIPGPLVWTGE